MSHLQVSIGMNRGHIDGNLRFKRVVTPRRVRSPQSIAAQPRSSQSTQSPSVRSTHHHDPLSSARAIMIGLPLSVAMWGGLAWLIFH